jgi:hypothetical protein
MFGATDVGLTMIGQSAMPAATTASSLPPMWFIAFANLALLWGVIRWFANR